MMFIPGLSKIFSSAMHKENDKTDKKQKNSKENSSSYSISFKTTPERNSSESPEPVIDEPHPSLKRKPQESGNEFRSHSNSHRYHKCLDGADSKYEYMMTVDEEEHHTRLGEHAAKLWKHKDLTDITIKLRNVRYEAHKTVLSCYSRYFERVLLSNSHSSVINLESKSVTNEAFSVLLQFMYTSNLAITCQNIGEVYTAARKLGMDEALNICVKILNGSRKREVHSVYTYVTAKQLGLKEASDKALRNMCKRFEQIVGTQEFQDLKDDQVREYLSADTLGTRSEVIVYLAALKWISVQFLDREHHAVDVVRCVRFPLMTLNEILACHSPPLLPGLTEKPKIKEMLLKATCFISAKTVNEEKRFQRYNCAPRTYLLEREPLILWDPNIFDPELYALYAEEQAATAIQAAYRGYQTRMSIYKEHEAAKTIQAGYRGYQTRKSICEENDAAQTIQANYRGYQTRKFIDREQEAATTIQANYRGYQTRKSFSKGHEGDFNQDAESVYSMQDEEKKKYSFADSLRKSVTGMFKRASSHVEDTDKYSPQRDERKESGEFRGREDICPRYSDVQQPSQEWVPEVLSNADALAGHVKNVPKGGQKVFEEDAYHPDMKTNGEDRASHPPYSTEWSPDPQKDVTGRLPVQAEPPPWLPEVSSSLDALAGTVVNMTKNLEVPVGRSKGKLVFPGDYHYEHHNRQDSLDSILSKENEYKTKPEVDPVNEEFEMFRAIVITGGFEINDQEDSESDSKTSGPRFSPCCGRQDKGKWMFQYDPAADQWSEIGQMPRARHHHRLVYLNNIIYSIGGCDPNVTKTGKMVPLNTCYSFDLSSKKWKKLAKMYHCRMYHGAAALDGKIYVAGGKDHNDFLLDSVEVYDPKSNKWQEISDGLISPTMHLGLCAHNGELWAIGGMVQNEEKFDFITDVRCYSPTNKSWNHDVPNLPSPRAFIMGIESVNRVYVIGGTSYSDNGIYSDEMDCLSEMLYYDDIRKSWRNTTPLPEPCHSVGVATCGKSIFVLGGRYKQDVLDQVIVFTESPEHWYRCSSLPLPLCGFAAISVPKVLDSK